VLVGASGCGKTTLFNCILGMYKIDGGEIKIFNKKVEASNFQHVIGYMPQKTSLVPELTILEMLHYFANMQLMKRAAFEDRFAMISELLELPAGNSMIRNLSGGEQRRLSLAVAIIHDPLLLILDKPTVGLDFELCDKIWKFLHRQSSEKGLTVLITTHYLSAAAKAHRCGFMRNGVLIAEDEPLRILEHLNAETMDEAFYQLCSKGAEDKTLWCRNDQIKFYKIPDRK
jgi:ABC-type multidrug transport system ATPase subunit